MPDDVVLNEQQLAEVLNTLPNWEVRDGWLRRKYITPGWPHTLMLAQAVAFIAEAAWHHPDLELGYAQVVVKIQTHRVKAITESDVALARKIEETATWRPAPDAPLAGFPKNWVR